MVCTPTKARHTEIWMQWPGHSWAAWLGQWQEPCWVLPSPGLLMRGSVAPMKWMPPFELDIPAATAELCTYAFVLQDSFAPSGSVVIRVDFAANPLPPEEYLTKMLA